MYAAQCIPDQRQDWLQGRMMEVIVPICDLMKQKYDSFNGSMTFCSEPGLGQGLVPLLLGALSGLPGLPGLHHSPFPHHRPFF